MASQPQTVSFQQGVGGYSGVQDTNIKSTSPTRSYATTATIGVDTDVQSLLMFSGLIGSGTGQIPVGAKITSAVLTLQTTNKGDGATFHRMLQSWDAAATWNTFGNNGIQTDGVEARAAADANTGKTLVGATNVDVTTSVQAWADGEANHGWMLKSLGSDGWDFNASEASVRPRLVVTYTLDDQPPPPPPVDTTPPTASGLAANVTTARQDHTVVVTYQDQAGGTGVDVTKIDINDIAVSGGIAVTGVTTSVAGDGTVSATYTLASPDGFTFADNGTYSVSLKANEVSDLAGNAALAKTLASFTVDIPNPTPEPPPPTSQPQTVSFQQGVGGYSGAQDTNIKSTSPTRSYATTATIGVDTDVQSLLMFSGLIGSGTGQIPVGAKITSAVLTLQTTNKGDGATFHRMLQSWDAAATWNTFGNNGIQTDGVEARAAADANTGKTLVGATNVDVTTSVQAWADGEANHGWMLKSLGSDGWDFNASEASIKPQLVVTYTVKVDPPPPPQDKTAPTASATLPNLSSASQTHTIEVVYTDEVGGSGIDPASIGLDDLEVSGPGSVTVTGVTTAANANGSVTATYTLSSPGGFTPIDNGSHAVSLKQGAVLDHAGNAAAAGTLGAFSISIAPTTTPGGVGVPGRATTFTGGETRTFEHTNARKSFYHDGEWWAVLPDGANWSIHEYDDGVWEKASGNMLNNRARADIAFDDERDVLWVLNHGPSTVEPHLYRFAYDQEHESWLMTADIRVSAASGLTSGNWASNSEIALGLDTNGNPLLSSIGSTTVGTVGLHVAYATDTSLSTWAETTVDTGTVRNGGSNGDSKADFVTYTDGGVTKVAIAYSADGATNSWKMATHNVSFSSDYASGWAVSTIATSSQVAIDNHISAVAHGNTVYIAMKDDKNAIWLTSGRPGSWSTPAKVVNGGAEHDPSRPSLVLDDTNNELYIFYQDHTGSPKDIYYKKVSTGNLTFNPSDLGSVALSSPGLAFTDPQLPAHNVGSHTDNSFFVFAKAGSQIWHNNIELPQTDLFFV
ncbi:hypothetical protein [Microvirga pudoricolor]|uniref:hypothetical protein n=1 Tax=Microvirga pudoricolor TaxID=2778729 RepID=UPI0019529277|nr:hypothetical protein [Microvirga pudoricolor]MBM6595652.1 hypothetical protein [Microvirga pudoricolor]